MTPRREKLAQSAKIGRTLAGAVLGAGLALGLPRVAPAARGAGASSTPASDAPPASASASASSSAGSSGEAPPEPAWCAPELEALDATTCVANVDAEVDTLVIYLHGLIQPGTEWQWNLERAAARAARSNHFAVVVPRGVRRATASLSDAWTWPTGARRDVEDAVIDGWWSARDALAARRGKPFARVYVWGFSAGAYYVSSLALRGRLEVQGYAAFAGGAAPKRLTARQLGRRVPLYVGWGLKDKARKDPAHLASALRALGWPLLAHGRPNVGHAMTDAQAREAAQFLDGKTKKPKR